MTISAANSVSVRDAGETLVHTGKVVPTPVLVYGWAVDNSAFLEEARLLSLNAHGGVITLKAEVARGQSILLVDSGLGPDREARVVYAGPDQVGGRKIAFEFIHR